MIVWNDLSNTQWLDYPSQSNILRRTYVNGFLDVSQNIVARKDMEVHGDISVNSINASDISVNAINPNGGNVGIGTTSPEQKLHIRGNTDEYAVLAFEGVRSSGTEKTREGFIGVGAAGGNYGTDMIFKLRNGYGAVTWDSGSQDVLYMNGNTTRFYTANTERMTIISSGNVGIGTTSPTYKTEIHTGALMDLASSSDKYTALRLHADRGGGSNYNDVGRGIRFEMSHSGRGMRMETRSHATYSNGVSVDFFNYCQGWNTTPTMTLEDCGNVGIGTNNPSNGKLEIYGSVSKYLAAAYVNTNGFSSSWTGTRAISLYASNMIATPEVLLTSDERIKKNIVEVPDNLSLQMIRDLPIKYYNYIDEISKGPNKVIGFIAQEVKEIIPNAVSIGKDIIPDEYRLLEDFTWEDTDDSKFKLRCDLQDCSGVKHRFYVSNDPETEGNLIDIVANEDNTFTFDNSYSHIFLYGKEVDDFHRLDKNQIFAVGMSALQEVDRQLQAEKAKVATLETQLADVLTRLAALESA
jgi:hypothetical protein